MNITLQTALLIIVRAILQAVAGGFVARGVWSSDTIEILSGAVVVVLTAAWSYWEKHNLIKKANEKAD